MASTWTASHAAPHLVFHLLHFPDLPAKQAGVGLARKIGMDEAVRRFGAAGNLNGIIVGYDADCHSAKNYLTAIEHHFQNHPRCPACSIYFEHPLQGPLEPEVYEAVTAYELHLRYYVRALRFTGFPYAYHTIGSCMAVRADVYMKQGGMNKRRAGEDFYFLHKIIPLGGFTDLTATTVYPSPRASDRVPFGTGKAVRDYLNHEQIRTYPLEAFLDLKALFERLPSTYRAEQFLDDKANDDLPASLRTFLDAQGFAAALAEIRENTANEAALRKRFFRWFNGFQVMKFVHHARDHFYGEREVAVEAKKLLEILPTNAQVDMGASPRDLLKIYRDLDGGRFNAPTPRVQMAQKLATNGAC
jgi:hypothetical protein